LKSTERPFTEGAYASESNFRASVLRALLPNRAYHIVRRQGTPNAFQRELAHWLDLHGILDLDQHAGADEDLTRLGFIAKTTGDVGHRADSRVVEAPLEADCAQSGKAVRYADTEANIVPQPTLPIGQCSNGVTHFESHEHGLQRGVLYGHRIIEDHHNAVASVPFERPAVFDDDLADCCMVIAQ
jgi:hypothetical protein